MENMDLTEQISVAYRGKKVLVTGHTGFKGSWLTLWLQRLGAHVSGYALPAPTEPSMFGILQLAGGIDHQLGDVRDRAALTERFRQVRPDVVFHLAAQPLVRQSYRDPIGTFESNANGTLNVLEAFRASKCHGALVLITTDKVYRNHNTGRDFTEEDPYGGEDPYSMSKAVCELIIESYRSSFFPIDRHSEHKTSIASVRAGNCIGGGDFSEDRLLPDLARGFAAGQPVTLRNPAFTRPWQHVLEPLWGYLMVGAGLLNGQDEELNSGFNFAPRHDDVKSVDRVAETFGQAWFGSTWNARRSGALQMAPRETSMKEAELLSLSYAKAERVLGWQPTWSLEQALEQTAQWYLAYFQKADTSARDRLQTLCLEQIRAFEQRAQTRRATSRKHG